MHQISPTQDYLRKENRDLKFQVDELKEILAVNKQSLRKNFSSFSQESKSLIKMLFEENSKLRDRLNKNYDDMSIINSTMLIGEQIVIATESHEKRLIEELQIKIKSLKSELKQRERRIVELEQCRASESKGGLPVRIVNITAAGSLQMKYHEDLERLNVEIKNKQVEIEKIKGKYEDLLKVNILLNKQMLDMRIPATSSGTSPKRVSSTYKNLLEYHHQFGKSDSESSYNSHNSSDEQVQQKVEKKSKVPKLELSKAKEIQELIIKKINNKEKKQGGNKTQLNEQKSSLYKEYQEEKLRNNMNQKKIIRLTRIVTELEQRNKMLVEAKISNNPDQCYLMDCPSVEYMQELEIRHMLDIAKDVYLNEALDKVIREEVMPEYRDGALSA